MAFLAPGVSEARSPHLQVQGVLLTFAGLRDLQGVCIDVAFRCRAWSMDALGGDGYDKTY